MAASINNNSPYPYAYGPLYSGNDGQAGNSQPTVDPWTMSTNQDIPIGPMASDSSGSGDSNVNFYNQLIAPTMQSVDDNYNQVMPPNTQDSSDGFNQFLTFTLQNVSNTSNEFKG